MWKILESKVLAKLGLFKVRQDKCQLPDGRIMPKYYVVEFPDWVHIVPITDAGEMVLVDQYRHAAQDRFLELPGGTTEPQTGESDIEGAQRELQEETGYIGQLQYVGAHYPNPALQQNRVLVYLALNCKLEGQQALDPFEDIKVVRLPVKEVFKMAESGLLSHGLMLGSLFMAKPYLDKYL